jgi:hypothetical protein
MGVLNDILKAPTSEATGVTPAPAVSPELLPEIDNGQSTPGSSVVAEIKAAASVRTLPELPTISAGRTELAAAAPPPAAEPPDGQRPEGERVNFAAQDFSDLYTIGRDLVQRTGENFAVWKEEMIKALGAWVETHLMPVWQQVILDKKLRTDLGSVSRFAGEWVNWQNQNWDTAAGMTNAEKALREELASTLEKELALREELVATNAKLGESDAPSTAEGTLRSQRAVVIWLAVAAIVLAAVLPPWSQGLRAGIQVHLGYAPIWSPPYPAARIDLERLLIEWLLVGSIAGSLLFTLQEVVTFVSARRKALRRVAAAAAAIGLCWTWIAIGPQLLDNIRQSVWDFRTDQRSNAWTAYSAGIRDTDIDAKVIPQAPDHVLDYLGNGRYRASSYAESPDFEERLYFILVLKHGTHPSVLTAAEFVKWLGPEWRLETTSITKGPGGPTVNLRPKLSLDLDSVYWSPSGLNLSYGGLRMTDEPMTDAEQIIADSRRTGQPIRSEVLSAAIRKLAPQFNYTDGGTIRRFSAKNPHLGLNELTFYLPDSASATLLEGEPADQIRPPLINPWRPATERPILPDTEKKN